MSTKLRLGPIPRTEAVKLTIVLSARLKADLARYAEAMGFPIIPCNLCGSQENLQRKHVAAMLREWEKKYPGRTETIFNALGNVVTTHLLDRGLRDFAAIRASGAAVADGDLACDEDPALAAHPGTVPIAAFDRD